MVKRFYKMRYRVAAYPRNYGKEMTGHGYMEDLLPVMADKRFEILDLELADEPEPAEKDLTDLIELALATYDEAWFMELTGRQKACI
jgi:hypothetical protein